ncbi:hypothetical protein [Brevundimonas sp. NPDC046655]|uniref:hypothetical protein n=1 Tax=unclassified Brevundimonas TaxID=2622653 RepID=UPI00384F2A9F
MNPQLSPDDAHLNRLWNETFGQPMPVIGAPDVVRRILLQNGVPARDLNHSTTSTPQPSLAPKGAKAKDRQ